MTEEWFIRQRLGRLGLSDLTDTVLAAGMSWSAFQSPFCVLAADALNDARRGIVPLQSMQLIAGMSYVPDAVYQRLYALVAAALTDQLARVPKNGRVH